VNQPPLLSCIISALDASHLSIVLFVARDGRQTFAHLSGFWQRFSKRGILWGKGLTADYPRRKKQFKSEVNVGRWLPADRSREQQRQSIKTGRTIVGAGLCVGLIARC